MKSRKRVAAVSLAATCALAGAAAGITQSSAAKTKAPTRSALRHGPAGMPGFGHGPGGGAVHAVEEVLNKAGTAYISETVDNGEVTAVDASAGTITLKEGTSTVTYGTPTITIPSGATVTLDGSSSSLEKLKAGDHATVASSSEGTTVAATDSSFKPGEGHQMGTPPTPGGGQPPSGQAPPSEGSNAG
jgi:hypothetical protein